MTRRTRRRTVTAALAPAAALAAWALMRLTGIDLEVSVGDGVVGPVDVVVAALLGALAGWAAVRFLERHSPWPREHWSYLSSAALAVSVIGPSWLAEGASAAALIGLHVVVAAVVIVGFARTLPARQAQPAPMEEADPLAG